MTSSTEEVNILKTDVSIDLQELPEVIPPLGIPPERQKYLYEQIRMFCEPEYTDITCPQPELNSVLSSSLQSLTSKAILQPAKAAAMCMVPHAETCPPQPTQSIFKTNL